MEMVNTEVLNEAVEGLTEVAQEGIDTVTSIPAETDLKAANEVINALPIDDKVKLALELTVAFGGGIIVGKFGSKIISSGAEKVKGTFGKMFGKKPKAETSNKVVDAEFERKETEPEEEAE